MRLNGRPDESSGVFNLYTLNLRPSLFKFTPCLYVCVFVLNIFHYVLFVFVFLLITVNFVSGFFFEFPVAL